MSKDNTKLDIEQQETSQEHNQDVIPEVKQEFSKVATSPKQSLLILGAIIILVGYLIFNIFISNDNEKDKKDNPKKIITPNNVIKPTTDSNNSPVIPQLPELPKLVAPKEVPLEVKVTEPVELSPQPLAQPALPLSPSSKDLPKPPVKELPMPASARLDIKKLDPILLNKIDNSEEAEKRRETKRTSSIVLLAGAVPKKSEQQLRQEADFTYRGDLSYVLARGKVIDAILEVAINSDLSGEIRAVITKDVYAEFGKNILVPKGSKIFGKYITSSDGGAYGRVSVEWFRIDLLNGYTINIASSGNNTIDSLGRTGVQGRVDNKVKEQMANAVLMSAFNIAVAKGLDKLVPPPMKAQAATDNQNTATNIQNIVSATSARNDLTEDQKVEQICAQAQSAIGDKTSSGYTSLVQACNAIRTTPSATPGQKISSITSSVNSAVSSLLTSSVNSNSTTQAQDASKQAFTEVTDKLKSVIEQSNFKPTITIDQGTKIKIYVNKDYLFPLAALSKKKVIQ